jgi:predicted permease
MSSLTETVFFVFGLIALGYIASLSGYLKAGSGEVLAEFAVGIAMPLLLFRTMTKVDFHGSAPWALWGAYFCAIAVAWTVGHFVTTRIFDHDARGGVVGGVSSSFSNLVLLGIPFVSGVMGQPGVDVLSLLISVHLPVMMMASVILFESFNRPPGSSLDFSRIVRGFLRKVFINPLIIGILAGLAWRMTGLELPGPGARLIDTFAYTAGPVALFAIGVELSGFGISGNLRAALSLSAVKLVVMPAAALAFALAFGLPPLTARIAVVAASLPAGFNSYLIATQFGTGQALASSQLTLSTVLAALSAAVWLMIATLIFG